MKKPIAGIIALLLMNAGWAQAVVGAGQLAIYGPSGSGSGSGTVTVLDSGTLTAAAIVTGGGGTTIQTAAPTATMDSSGNISTPGSVTTGSGGSSAGYIGLGQGTAPSTGTTSVKIAAPASVTSYIRILPGAVGSTGYVKETVSGSTQTESVVTSIPAADVAVGALADGMTATTQAAGSADTKVATDAYANRVGLAGLVGTYASPDTTGGAVTLTQAVTEIWTNTTTPYTIPAVASSSGKAMIFYVVGTNAITIDPNASEIVVKDGTPLSGGTALTLTGEAGNYVCLVCDGTRWVTLGFKGTLGP